MTPPTSLYPLLFKNIYMLCTCMVFFVKVLSGEKQGEGGLYAYCIQIPNKYYMNCKWFPVSLLIVRLQWLSWIQILNCLKCQLFHTSSQAMSCHGFCIVFVTCHFLSRSCLEVKFSLELAQKLLTALGMRTFKIRGKCNQIKVWFSDMHLWRVSLTGGSKKYAHIYAAACTSI